MYICLYLFKYIYIYNYIYMLQFKYLCIQTLCIYSSIFGCPGWQALAGKMELNHWPLAKAEAAQSNTASNTRANYLKTFSCCIWDKCLLRKFLICGEGFSSSQCAKCETWSTQQSAICHKEFVPKQ